MGSFFLFVFEVCGRFREFMRRFIRSRKKERIGFKDEEIVAKLKWIRV